MYAQRNFKTKKALKEAVAAGPVGAFQPGGLFEGPTDGPATIEGPHFPEPHRWYARVLLRGGYIVKVLS